MSARASADALVRTRMPSQDTVDEARDARGGSTGDPVRAARASTHRCACHRCPNADANTCRSDRPLRARITLSSYSRNCRVDARAVSRRDARWHRARADRWSMRKRVGHVGAPMDARAAATRSDAAAHRARDRAQAGKPLFMRLSRQRAGMRMVVASGCDAVPERSSDDACATCARTARDSVRRRRSRSKLTRFGTSIDA